MSVVLLPTTATRKRVYAAREVAPSTLFGAYREAAPGSYAATVRLTERLITCATCARRVRAAEAEELGWTSELDPPGDVSWSCPLCAHLAARLAPHGPA